MHFSISQNWQIRAEWKGMRIIYINPFSAEYKVQRILIMLSITYDQPPKSLNALTKAIKLE